MPELDKLYDSKFEDQIKNLKKWFGILVTDLNNSVKSLKKINDGLVSIEKTRENLNKQEIAAEKIRREIIKTDAQIIKNEKEQEKVLQEKQKRLALANKKLQETEKLRQQKIRTDAEVIKKEKEQVKVLAEKRKVLSLNTKKELEAQQVKQQKIRTAKEEEKAIIQTRKETERLTKAEQKEAEASKKATIAAKNQETKYKKLSVALTEARKDAREIGLQFGLNSKQFKKAERAVGQLDNKIKKLDARLGQSQRKVGSYSDTFKRGLKSMLAFGVGFIGIQQGIRLLSNSIKTIANFEKAMDKVQAVTGATDKQIKLLTADSKRLGSTTSKTSTEVAGLQMEFAKLGFSTAEILAATEATISLSIAAGSDLAESAVVAASTVRGFGLSARETQRVVDVMAKSFASSALDLEKFKTGMGIAAPVAKAFGKDIEFTTAQLSVLSDAGVDASTAGTSLRNMFLQLTKHGMTWEQGLEAINKSTNKAKTGLELFGKRGVTAALILADNTEKAKELEEAYDGAAGAAQEMADIMEDNLIGDVDKLKSAWEGFILGLNKGEGDISNAFRGIIQWLSKVVEALIFANSTLEEFQNRLGMEFVSKIKKRNQEILVQERELFNERVAMLNRFVKDERITVEQAKKKEAEFREQMDNKVLAKYERYVKKQLFLAKRVVSDVEYEAQAGKVKELTDLLDKDGLARQLHIVKLIKEKNEYAELAAQYDKSKGAIELLESELLSITLSYDKLNTVIEEDEEIIEKNTTAIIKQIDVRSDLNDLLDKELSLKQLLSDLDAETEESISNQKDLVDELAGALKEMNDEMDSDFLKSLDEQEAAKIAAHKAELERAEERRAAMEQGFGMAVEFTNVLMDIDRQKFDAKLMQVEEEHAVSMELAGDNELAKRSAERRFAIEKAKINRASAQAEKNQTLFNIAIQTGLNVVKAFPNPLLMLGATILGGTQAVAVSSRPLPKVPAFDKGTKRAPGGFLQIAEKRPEFAIKNGKAKLFSKHTITDELKGAEIIGGRESAEIMNHAKSVGFDDHNMQREFNNLNSNIRNMRLEVGINNWGQPYVKRNDKDKVTRANYYG